MVQTMTIVRTIEIPASSEEVWNAVKDFGGIYKWNPYVQSVSLLSESNEGEGAVRVCHMYDGTSIKESVSGMNYENMEMEVRIVDGLPSAMKEPPIALLKVSGDETRSKVSMTMDVSLRYGLVGRLMKRFMVEPRFASTIEHLLKGLRTYIESDAYIGKRGKLLSADEARMEWETADDRLAEVPFSL